MICYVVCYQSKIEMCTSIGVRGHDNIRRYLAKASEQFLHKSCAERSRSKWMDYLPRNTPPPKSLVFRRLPRLLGLDANNRLCLIQHRAICKKSQFLAKVIK